MTVVLHGTTIVGTIQSNQRLYKIESTGGTLHHLIEIDEEALPPNDHPLVVTDDDSTASPPTGGISQQTEATAAATGDSTVDLLVVYTSTAKTKEGGQAAMEASITLGVDSANQAYGNSQIAMQLRLVHTAEVAYTESGAINTDLTRLQNTTDGIMDQIHQLRDQHKADLVALIVDNGGNSCGIAYVTTNGPRAGFANDAFSVTARDCIANNTFAHELGHYMGNAHDRAYGYRDDVGKFRTIMAYGCPTVSCPRVKYFSNPRLLYNGRPLGIDHTTNPSNSADNARSMNDVRQIVAAWRAATTDGTPPATPSGIQVRECLDRKDSGTSGASPLFPIAPSRASLYNEANDRYVMGKKAALWSTDSATCSSPPCWAVFAARSYGLMSAQHQRACGRQS